MIDGLIGGKLFGKAAKRTGQSGKAFTTAKVRTATADGDSVFVNVITFSDEVGDALLALDDGDSISLSGALSVKVGSHPGGNQEAILHLDDACLTRA